MIKTPILGLATLFVVCIAVSATRMNRPYDCSGTTQIEPLSKFASGVCKKVSTFDENEFEEYKEDLEPDDRLDIVEICTCNLLRHELAWKALVNHRINTIYLATHKLVDEAVAKKRKQLDVDTDVPTKELLTELGDDDGHIFYWDNLSNLLVEAVEEPKKATNVAQDFMNHYSKVYYNPETYTRPYNAISIEMQKEVSLTCSKHIRDFDIFLFYFDRLKSLSGNERFVLEVVGYNYDLYRLFTAMKLCDFLSRADYIGWKVDD